MNTLFLILLLADPGYGTFSIASLGSLLDRQVPSGPALAIPMMLGCAGLSYYNFAHGAYGDK